MLGRFGKLFDLVLGLVEHVHPLVDDGLSKPADDKYHYRVKDYTGDDQSVEDLSVLDHVKDFICHRYIERKLTKRYQGFPSRHGVQHYDRRHYQCEIKCAGLMHAVEKETPHHEYRVEPEADIRRGVMSDVQDPCGAYSGDNEQERPFLPSEKERFRNEDRCKYRIADQYGQM